MATSNNYPQYRKKLDNLVGRLGDELPDAMQGFQQLHKGAIHDATLDEVTKELIALGIAVAVRCDGCIAYHTKDALQAGATRDEIIEAIGVAILMGGGPALVYGAEALEALDQFTEAQEPAS